MVLHAEPGGTHFTFRARDSARQYRVVGHALHFGADVDGVDYSLVPECADGPIPAGRPVSRPGSCYTVCARALKQATAPHLHRQTAREGPGAPRFAMAQLESGWCFRYL